ncbi:MAG: nucleoside deaminase [Candidatus Limnocylindrales bacterium]
MHYELYMRAALAEAEQAKAAGERANGAVAILDEAMVAHGRESVVSTGDPTAHAVMIALREAATRLRRRSLAGMTVFCVVEPCPMCVGALLACDADGVVFALSDPSEGACLSALNLAECKGLNRRLQVVSGILQEDAAEVRPDLSPEGATT